MKRATYPFLSAGLLAAGLGLTALRGQSVPTALAPIVVTATRIPESSASVGTAVDVVSGSELDQEQLSTLADALSGVPSAPVFATGQAGAAASIFMRGADSDQTLFLVDGIRINDPNTEYANFLSGARVFPSDTVEVDRGPQSTLYGGSAAGGVVSLRLAEGTGAPSGSVEAEAGSFGTVDGSVSAQGAGGPWAYNVNLSGDTTDNDRINNRFDSGSFAARIDYRISQYLSAGATVRGFESRYGDPSDVFTNNPYDYETESNWLATVFLQAQLTQYVSSHLIVGGQDSVDWAYEPSPGQPTVATEVSNRRGVIDWQNTIEITGSNSLVAGVTLEDDKAVDTGYGAIDQGQTLVSAYSEDVWTLPDSLTLTAGLRRDDYDTFGSASTGRATAAWLPLGKDFKLRASYGTAFNAPSLLDLYGQAIGYQGNPDLQPERSDGWDFGFDFYSPATQSTFSATWFQTDYTDLIEDNFYVYPATTENIDQARTRGIELSYRATIAGVVQARLAYTRLEADDLTEDAPLLRRPHYTASADLEAPIGAFRVGIGAGWVGTRADIDPVTYDTIFDPSYAVARAYASWQVSKRLALKARVENALDRDYQPVAGYPEPGRAFYGGASLSF